jgi:hypothetical protein
MPFLEMKVSAAYRWDRIKTLAKMEPYVDTPSKLAPDNNADSIAYFAMGMENYSLVDIWRTNADKRRMLFNEPENYTT